MFQKEILPDFFKCCLEPCFTPPLFSFTMKVGCQRAHLRLLYVFPCLLKTGGVSILFPLCYLSRHLRSLRCFMSICVIQSAVLGSETGQGMLVQYLNHFGLLFHVNLSFISLRAIYLKYYSGETWVGSGLNTHKTSRVEATRSASAYYFSQR